MPIAPPALLSATQACICSLEWCSEVTVFRSSPSSSALKVSWLLAFLSCWLLIPLSFSWWFEHAQPAVVRIGHRPCDCYMKPSRFQVHRYSLALSQTSNIWTSEVSWSRTASEEPCSLVLAAQRHHRERAPRFGQGPIVFLLLLLSCKAQSRHKCHLPLCAEYSECQWLPKAFELLGDSFKAERGVGCD